MSESIPAARKRCQAKSLSAALVMVLCAVLPLSALAEPDWLRPPAPWEEQADLPRPDFKQGEAQVKTDEGAQNPERGRNLFVASPESPESSPQILAAQTRTRLAERREKPSAVEDMYARRVVQKLDQ
ncbi:MAG: hypothetical protein L6Q57_09475, partial [Alphaproteobacteria bacterium]|nr:hypothetical protein [Alphaproteobacteria bacterium]